MDSFSNFLAESANKYKLSFRKIGDKGLSTVVATGTKEEMLKAFNEKYPGFSVYDDFGSKFANGDGMYAAKTSGKGAGEVTIMKV